MTLYDFSLSAQWYVSSLLRLKDGWRTRFKVSRRWFMSGFTLRVLRILYMTSDLPRPGWSILSALVEDIWTFFWFWRCWTASVIHILLTWRVVTWLKVWFNWLMTQSGACWLTCEASLKPKKPWKYLPCLCLLDCNKEEEEQGVCWLSFSRTW